MRLGSAAVFLILLMNVSTGQTLTCGPYSYETPDGCCPMCPLGGRVYADCTESRSTLCKPCPDGTFMDHLTARPVCYNCKSCDEGSGLKMKTSCTIVSDTVCEPLEGFYCSDSRKDDCVEARKHRRCKPGEYITEHGTSSTDTVCSTCSDGTFSNGMFSSCQKHTQCESKGRELLRAGTETEDAQCGGLLLYRTVLIIFVVVVVILLMFLVFVLGGCLLRWRIRHQNSGKVSTVTMKYDHVYFIDIMVCLIIYLIFISNVLFQKSQ
ncbi:tumor necrosis factor receptor superfamily member 5-like [Labrus mixtus]|uniref:tumor necrosis factor receptor superfamily member 5-like n=1 Tax=Labrus mixtus TaxID=508554 RepID=UPI0029BFD55E|nr:tumor necrosis factor receptor superfamily member 5-like [Labrus mixtus]XP_060884101.1 tumor necrosis factor receptor superfamily member 5-like [Labrus mixtus]XP_060884102.1 tumor necrosis factor receptor superfamily member 5-like [Labrus mixtus]XP_060884103.1 tumor necrosis factor receptor superfamily member 5-like [Labrus mixtus]XP_060884104.1 tumor necrosis factor receptor superfamily member 5-like [Labrus mixtus]